MFAALVFLVKIFLSVLVFETEGNELPLLYKHVHPYNHTDVSMLCDVNPGFINPQNYQEN